MPRATRPSHGQRRQDLFACDEALAAIRDAIPGATADDETYPELRWLDAHAHLGHFAFGSLLTFQSLDPSDDQGARFHLASVTGGHPWTDEQPDGGRLA